MSTTIILLRNRGMSSARRRSTRLIESPWVYNWPKKAPVYINLDSEESNLVDRQTKNLNKKGTDKGSTMQNRKTKPIRMQSKGEKNLNAKFVRLVNEEETKFNTDAAVAEGSRRRHVNRGIGKKKKQAVGVDVGKLVISKCPVKVRQVVKVRWST
ncbi:hypothetical protein DCAR_0101140 [Daucus carota subsp. sativus]|uniref:Uncharacterized protein n=1 Tax=Daucus carota subsp. sativus TaxID=79200 RepID=A0A166G668_DAUCS|nr:hypothetical protein DCAR_0101140 [Daucus carota subsp. sativus]